MITQREFSLRNGGLISLESGTQYRGVAPVYNFDKDTGRVVQVIKGIPWIRITPRRHEK